MKETMPNSPLAKSVDRCEVIETMLKLDRYFKFSIKFVVIFLSILITCFVPFPLSIHLPLLTFLPCLNYLELYNLYHNFKVKLVENKLHVATEQVTLDEIKMEQLTINFRVYICEVALRVFHFFTILYVRGFKLNLFDVLILGKPVLSQFHQMLDELNQYLEFSNFLTTMEESMEEVKYPSENQELCSICQENMTVGRKLVECPHVFHYYCIA